jgi:hypothetical protein
MGIVSTASSINTTAKGRGSVEQPIGVIGVIGGCCQQASVVGAVEPHLYKPTRP